MLVKPVCVPAGETNGSCLPLIKVSGFSFVLQEELLMQHLAR